MSQDSLTDNTEEIMPPALGLVEWFRPGEHARVEQLLADIKQLGINELRTGISPADYLASGGKDWFNWLIPTLAQHINILPYFTLSGAESGVSTYISSAPVQWPDVIQKILTDLGNYFEWVELQTEPTTEFTGMLSSVMKLAKQNGKKVVLSGINPNDHNQLSSLFTSEVLPYIDALGLTNFRFQFAPKATDWKGIIGKVQSLLNQNTSTAEIWITEAGFSTWQHDEFMQLQVFRNVLKANVARVYWYNLQDQDQETILEQNIDSDEREHQFGLKHADGSPKLLYRLIADYGITGLNRLTCIKRNVSYNPEDKYTVITGGAGFVGTNLAKRLLEAGKRVVVLDNLSRAGVERNLQWLHDHYENRLEVYVGDIRDLATIKRIMKGADQVFHFAAQVAVTTSLHAPINDFEINARGIINVLEAIRAQDNPPSLVFTSTNKVYGGLEDLVFVADGSRYNPSDKYILQNGIGESRSLDFHSPYGCSKGAADQYVIDYARTYGIPAVVFRMSCIYGPHQYGTEDQGWVAHFVIRAIENEPISIYGDGKQVRDVLFVEDLVDAFLLAQKHIATLSGQAFNIGGGPENTTSLLELLDLIGEFQGQKIPMNFGDWRPGDQHYYVSDIRKFKKATGWYPKHSVPEGVAKLYRWLCEARGIEVPADFMMLVESENTKVVVA